MTAGVLNQQINLFQPIFRKEKKLLSFRVLIQAISAVVVLLVFMLGWSTAQTWQIQGQLQRLQVQLNTRNAKLGELGKRLALMKTNTSQQDELTALELELTARQKVVDALTRARDSYSRGVSAYLESFARQAPKGVWLTGFSVKAGGEGLIIRGSSLKPELVPVFLQHLSTEPTMAGTQFGLLQIRRENAEARYVDFIVYTGDELPKEIKP